MLDTPGLFESMENDSTQHRVAARRALALAHNRVEQNLGRFLRGAQSEDEFFERLALVQDDFAGYVTTAAEEVGHEHPEHIAASLKDHYRLASVSPSKVAEAPTQTSPQDSAESGSEERTEPLEAIAMVKEAPGSEHMKGVSPKRNRQYEHIKEQLMEDGKDEERAKEEAARTVNKQRSEHGETKSSVATGGWRTVTPLPDSHTADINVPGRPGEPWPEDPNQPRPRPAPATPWEALRDQPVRDRGTDGAWMPNEQPGIGTHYAPGLGANDFYEGPSVQLPHGEMIAPNLTMPPLTDDPDLRRRLGPVRQGKTAEVGGPGDPWGHMDVRHMCPQCGSERYPGRAGACPDCGYMNVQQPNAQHPMAQPPPQQPGFFGSAQDTPMQDDDSSRLVTCPECGGDGTQAGVGTCRKCKGKGKVPNFGDSMVDALGTKGANWRDWPGQDSGPEPEPDYSRFPPCPSCGEKAGFSILPLRGGTIAQCKNCNAPANVRELSRVPNQSLDSRGMYNTFEQVRALPETEHPLGPHTGKTAEDGNSGLDGPEPKMDKRKWTPQNPGKPEIPDGHWPTEEKDVIKPIHPYNRSEDGHDLKEIGERFTEREALPANDGDAGFSTGGPTPVGQGGTFKNDGQTTPVTRESPPE